jgi:hypothetical protein
MTQFSHSFSNIFLIDTSTVKTIDTGLKDIPGSQHPGRSAQDALQWLTNNSENWLLLFDNADDPKINLNQWFPRCNHGNILITSRNPGIRVYAGSDSVVSDMEEADAVALLLKSAAQENKLANREIAADIVKVSQSQLLICLILSDSQDTVVSAACYHSSRGIYLKVRSPFRLLGPLCCKSSPITQRKACPGS